MSIGAEQIASMRMQATALAFQWFAAREYTVNTSAKAFFLLRAHDFGFRDAALSGLRIRVELTIERDAEPADPFEGWTPTAANVNALPEPVRRYVADLATRCDPSGDVRDLTIAKDTIRALEASNRMLRDGQALHPGPITMIEPDDVSIETSEADARPWKPAC